MILQFKVDGKAVGKARPRVTMHGAYTPRQTVQYEKKIQAAYQNAYGGFRFADGAPVALSVIVAKAPPKNTSKAKRAQMLSGAILPVQRPDWDNYGKIVSDALNGLAWNDDSTVVIGEVVKVYSDSDWLGVIISDASTFWHRVREIKAYFE